jgi:uncharacterized membrane protein
MKLKLSDQVALATLAGTFVLTAAVYRELPPRIPTHFDLHGIANGWMDRPVGAWLLPAVTLGLWIFLRAGAALLPSSWKERMHASPIAISSAILVGVLAALQAVILYAAMAAPPNVAKLLGLVLSAFALGFGLVMPRLRRNPWIGIRTPWTLTSDEVWARTHRLGGALMVAAGLVSLSAIALGHAALAPVAIVVAAVVPAVHSFMLARRLD